jgi:hypothetical protein
MNNLSEEIQLIWQDLDVSTKDTMVYGTATAASWINVSRFHRYMVVIFRTVGTGGVDGAQLRCASTVTGTGAATVASRNSTECTGLIAVSDGSNSSGALGERGVGQIVFEGQTKDLDSTLADADFLNVRVSADTATDEWGILWILSNPRYPTSGLTSTGNGSTAA